MLNASPAALPGKSETYESFAPINEEPLRLHYFSKPSQIKTKA